MTPIALATIAAVIATASGLLASSASGRRSWQLSFALVLVVVVTLSGWGQYVQDGFDGECMAIALDQNDNAVSTVLVVVDKEEQRTAHRFELSRTIPWAKDLFIILLVAAWLGFITLVGTRKRENGPPQFMGPVWLLLSALTGLLLWILLSTHGPGSGEAGVRAVLADYEVAGLKSFSVPSEPWRYVSPLLGVALASFGISILGLVSHWMPVLELKNARYGVGVGALLALAACGIQLMLVGGLPWRPLEGALWASAILIGGAWVENTRALSSALPCILALGICGMLVG